VVRLRLVLVRPLPVLRAPVAASLLLLPDQLLPVSEKD
jgi:hypothetical protein